MKIRHSFRAARAFTLVEIAIALGVIAFALVAIVGILPSGLNVERENREQTLVNQDGPYFLEAIRNGSRGLEILTNYVDSITITSTSNTVQNIVIYTNSPSASAPFNGNMVNARWIIGLLGTPKYLNGFTNRVDAHVHALSGAAIEHGKDTARDLGFSYSIFSEIVPVNFHSFEGDTNHVFDAEVNGDPKIKRLQDNLWEVRLNFRWPLLPNGDVGNGRKIYRTYVSGRLVQDPSQPDLWFLAPENFAQLR